MFFLSKCVYFCSFCLLFFFSSIVLNLYIILQAIYEEGGKNFWVHNTGPIGCLPKSLATYNKYKDDYDEHGCLISLNEGAKIFNDKLYLLSEKLRDELKNTTIVYVDVYSIKYDLIANSSNYGKCSFLSFFQKYNDAFTLFTSKVKLLSLV